MKLPWRRHHKHNFVLSYNCTTSKIYRCDCGECLEIENEEEPAKSLTAKEFISRFARNYINYAALVEVAFGLGDDMFQEYERLTPEDQRAIIEVAKKYAARA